MNSSGIWRRLRGAIGNAVVWGGAWAASALVVFGVLRITGILSEGHWGDGIVVAGRFGFVGAIASVAFSGVVRLLYRGRRLSEINWVRFGAGGAVVAGSFVLGMMIVPRLLSGEAMLPLGALLVNGLMAAGFGGVAAAGSLILAQRAEALRPEETLDRFSSSAEDVDQLVAGSPATWHAARSFAQDGSLSYL